MSTPTGVRSAAGPRLAGLGAAIGRAATHAEACAAAVARVGAAFDGPCAIRTREDTRVLAATADCPSAPPAGAIVIPLGEGPQALELIVEPSAHAGGAALTGAGASVGAGPLDDPAWREALGAVVGSALQLVEVRAREEDARRRSACVDRFARALIGIADSAALHRAIVEHMAGAVGAEVGALAVFVPQDNSLAITATLGYPAVLVEHVRIAPNDGVLGRVFATGEPILVPSLHALAGGAARRRYRTDSYVALPLAGPDGVVAVVALTDKSSAAPFSEADLAMLAGMSAPAALAVARELLRDRTNDLAHLATVDALTGLFNRRYFETRLEQELQRQVRQPDDLSLLMLDLDNFKELNDTQGHLVGDLALREVAEILRRAVRIFDVCARYGGEEFVILMPGAGASTALRIAERIRRQVEQHFASGLRSSVPIPLTVSVGVSTARPNVTRDALVTQADEALLRAKGTGKNQVHLHDGAVGR